MAAAAPTCVDGTTFGPASGCRTFDFTTLFENTILVILPNLVFIALFTFTRLPKLVHKERTRPPVSRKTLFSRLGLPFSPHVTNKSKLHVQDRPLDPDSLPTRLDWLGALRIVLALTNAVLVAALLGLSQTEVRDLSGLGRWSFTAAQALSFVGALFLAAAVWSERLFTRGGSYLVPFFILCTILFDGARLRTFNMLSTALDGGPLPQSSSFFRIFAATVGLKVLLLFSESINTDAGETAEDRATFVSRLGFFWLYPVMSKGYSRALTMEDLPRLGEDFLTETLYAKISREWDFTEQAKLKKQGLPTRSLLFAIARAFPKFIYAPILSKLALTAVVLAQPYLISNVITFVTSWAFQFPGSPPPQPVELGWSLAGAFVLCYTVNAVGEGVYNWITAQNGATVRGIIIGQLYAKSLRIHLAEAGNLGSAGAVNLMSADVERILTAISPIHDLWSGVTVVAIGLYILYSQIGTLFVVPLVVTFFLMFGGPSLGINLGRYQKEWSACIDQRLAVTSSMINGIKAIKMAGLEHFFERKLLALRQKEMAGLSKYLITLAHVIYISTIGQGLLIAVTFAALAITTHLHPNYSATFDQRTVFTALAALNVVTFPILMIGQNFALAFAAYASFKRVEGFLLSEEKDLTEISGGRSDSNVEKDSPEQTDLPADDATVKFESLSLQWDAKGDPILKDITVDFQPGITMVIGPLSCGKSTLLTAVLAEPHVTSGHLITPATRLDRKPIAYASQDSWMQETLSLRANITFHSEEPFDEGWYDTVVSACCLHQDFATFEKGDLRLAKSLSGGQRQRVSLARAIYAREADIVVLDDPFCALDGETEARTWSSLFDKSDGLLRDKTVILASNALHRLKDVDWIVRLGEGTILQQGPPAAVQLSEDDIKALQAAAQKARSKAVKAGTKSKAQAGAGTGDLQEILDEDGDDDDSVELTEAEDKHNLEKHTVEEDKDGNVIEDVKVGNISLSNYWFWMQCAGPHRFALMIASFAFASAGVWGMQSYLQKWTIRSPQSQYDNFGALIGGLFALLFVYFVIEAFDIYLCIGIIAPRAGLQLHRRVLAGVLGAPLSFFDAKSSGQILNRFSQDLYAADGQWMMFLGGFLVCLLNVIGSLILMAISSPYLLLAIGIVAVMVYILRIVYLPNSRQLRRLDLSSKSPLYTLFGDSTTDFTISGLAVIRAFGRQKTLLRTSINYTDASQRPLYMLEACRRWLLVYTNLSAMLCNTGLVLLVVGLRSSHTATLIGVALAQTVNLAIMIGGVVQTWCEAEIAGVVFERLQEFSQTSPEHARSTRADSARFSQASESDHDEKAYSSSPVQASALGAVVFDKVVLSYTPGEGQPVLNGLSFSVAPGEHLGICGRTGSGKSTLLLALLRMVERQSGDIQLGGQSIDSYDLHDLRRSIAVVGQDPLVVSGASVRENLGLEGELPEDRIWAVLKDVQLADYIKGLPEGLDTVLDNKTARLSQGRRQLLTIARVLLNPKQVVVLDEISSSIDEETDAVVQKLLRTELRSSTVISIAHRTAAVMDYDRVMVLAAGEILELDTPSVLLANPASAFRALAVHQGVCSL
ncbi:hypothetical protein V8E36_007236 [Tilletia maclaganii]